MIIQLNEKNWKRWNNLCKLHIYYMFIKETNRLNEVNYGNLLISCLNNKMVNRLIYKLNINASASKKNMAIGKKWNEFAISDKD